MPVTENFKYMHNWLHSNKFSFQRRIPIFLYAKLCRRIHFNLISEILCRGNIIPDQILNVLQHYLKGHHILGRVRGWSAGGVESFPKTAHKTRTPRFGRDELGAKTTARDNTAWHSGSIQREHARIQGVTANLGRPNFEESKQTLDITERKYQQSVIQLAAFDFFQCLEHILFSGYS